MNLHNKAFKNALVGARTQTWCGFAIIALHLHPLALQKELLHVISKY